MAGMQRGSAVVIERVSNDDRVDFRHDSYMLSCLYVLFQRSAMDHVEQVIRAKMLPQPLAEPLSISGAQLYDGYSPSVGNLKDTQ